MPLFRRNSVAPASHATPAAPTTPRSSGLFGTRRSAQPQAQTQDPSNLSTPSPSSPAHHLFSKRATLSHAQAKLRTAQADEAAADRALGQSRASVKAAKAEIARLEREAKEEARMAKMHVGEAGRMRKEGDKLGRHL